MGIEVADGGIKPSINLVDVSSLALRPIFSVEVIEMEGVVDVHFARAQSSVEKKPVLLIESKKSRLSRSWHISFLIEFCPLQSIQIESQQLAIWLAIAIGAPEDVPFVSSYHSGVCAY
jgi:hypothetical protein